MKAREVDKPQGIETQGLREVLQRGGTGPWDLAVRQPPFLSTSVNPSPHTNTRRGCGRCCSCSTQQTSVYRESGWGSRQVDTASRSAIRAARAIAMCLLEALHHIHTRTTLPSHATQDQVWLCHPREAAAVADPGVPPCAAVPHKQLVTQTPQSHHSCSFLTLCVGSALVV